VKTTRRHLLVSAGAAAPALALTAAARQAGGGELAAPPRRRLKVVVCGGHPGDPEYGCGGTIARLTGLGHEVVLLYLNDGAWPPTPAATRLAEAARACAILKARPAWAGQVNGHAVVDAERYQSFRQQVAELAPDAVLTQWPLDNHADHRAIFALAYGAWQALERPFALYYYEVSNGEDTQQFSPGLYVDIASQEEQKRAACYAHASQTPDRYYALQDEVARFRGLECGKVRAEAFLMQLRSPCDVLSAALGRSGS